MLSPLVRYSKTKRASVTHFAIAKGTGVRPKEIVSAMNRNIKLIARAGSIDHEKIKRMGALQDHTMLNMDQAIIVIDAINKKGRMDGFKKVLLEQFETMNAWIAIRMAVSHNHNKMKLAVIDYNEIAKANGLTRSHPMREAQLISYVVNGHRMRVNRDAMSHGELDLINRMIIKNTEWLLNGGAYETRKMALIGSIDAIRNNYGHE